MIFASEQNLILAGIVASLGALISDLLIFSFVRGALADEIEQLKKERFISKTVSVLHPAIKDYMLMIFAGFIIASPLPDEIGVSLLAASRTLSLRSFAAVSFLLNTAGIFAMLWIGSVL